MTSAPLIPSLFTRWCPRGAIIGALCGLAAYLYLDWYFLRGPGAGSVDAGEAHGYFALFLGFPLSLLGGSIGRVGFAISAMIVWATLGAVVAGIGALIIVRVREAYTTLRPPAG